MDSKLYTLAVLVVILLRPSFAAYVDAEETEQRNAALENTEM